MSGKHTLDQIEKEGVIGAEESDQAYYIWPKARGPYLSHVYRMDKGTKEIQSVFLTDAIDDYPDFLERTNEVPFESLKAI